MGVDRQIVLGQGPCVFQKVSSHPVILAASRYIANLFAKVAAVEFGARFAGRTDVGDREPLIVGHCDQRGLAVTRVPCNSYLFRIYGFFSLEIIEGAAGAPRPSAQCAQSSSLRDWP